MVALHSTTDPALELLKGSTTIPPQYKPRGRAKTYISTQPLYHIYPPHTGRDYLLHSLGYLVGRKERKYGLAIGRIIGRGKGK